MGTARDRTLSVGVVGAGEIARIAHLPVLAAMPEVSLAWIADRDPERARVLAQGFGARALPLPGDLTRLPEADVVLLALPYGARAAYYEALAGRDSALLYPLAALLVGLMPSGRNTSMTVLADLRTSPPGATERPAVAAHPV